MRSPTTLRVFAFAAVAAIAPSLQAQSGDTTPAAASIRSLACSRDGSLLATASDTAIHIRSRADAKTLRDGTLAAPPRQLQFSPDGSILAAACTDGALRLFDTAGKNGTRTLFCGATSVAFLPDGSALVGDGAGKIATLTAAMLALAPGDSVDLRPNYERWGLLPKRQGSRGTCSVFTTTAAYEYALSRPQDRAVPLSEEFLNWAANDATGRIDDGSFFHDIIRGFDKHGACREELMPYRKSFDAALAPGAEARRDAASIKALGFTVHWINPWKPQAGLTAEHLAAIQQVLARGWPVCLGSSHSTLAVGYADDPGVAGGGSLCIRDSAIGGYRALTYEFVLAKIGDVFWVEPTPAKH